MLCGQGVVAIWNGITPEGRDEFYAWHVQEHMPERVGIPGFLRGRRYIAIDKESHPEFFTLYELQSFEVTTSQDYLGRLNAPTPWTKKATAAFLDSSRGLARVITSIGPGPGGVLATLRFSVDSSGEAAARKSLAALMYEISQMPMITGAHFCISDAEASGIKTNETRERKDIQAPPHWFIMIEACVAKALDPAVKRLTENQHLARATVGRYALEYTRLKNDWTAG